MKDFIPELSKEECDVLSKHIQLQEAPQGTVLDNDHIHKSLFFIKSGNIEMCNYVELDKQQLSIHVSSIKAPYILGDSTFIDSENKNTLLIASKPITYYRLTEESLNALKEDNPVIALKILEHAGKHMATRLNNAHERILERMTKSTCDIASTIKLINKFIGNTVDCTNSLDKKLRSRKTAASRKFTNINSVA